MIETEIVIESQRVLMRRREAKRVKKISEKDRERDRQKRQRERETQIAKGCVPVCHECEVYLRLRGVLHFHLVVTEFTPRFLKYNLSPRSLNKKV